MMQSHLEELYSYVRERHPRSLRGIEEARAISPDRFDALAEMFLGWLVAARGKDAIASATDAFVGFSTGVNMAQGRYELDGRYAHKSFAEVYADHYSQDETMADYLWGVFLTNFLWAHHTEISFFYRDHFLTSLPDAPALVEIAPGHGGWGVWALHVLPQARLQGFDISPSSVAIASSLCRAAGFEQRATYQEKNALDLKEMAPASADGLICGFVAEHLEQPDQLFAVIQHLLKPRAIGFITSVLTAAQVDHIYEFRFESELVKMCEDHGLRAMATLSAGPKRQLPGARFLPRSMALIVQRRTHETF
jgi:hypothetical protein